MTYERIKLAGNIGFSEIIDSKFKTGVLIVDFITNLNPETSSVNAAAMGSISKTNSKYPSLTDFCSKLNELYGSNIFSKVSRLSDCQVNSIGASWLDNKYALDGEDIEMETVNILLDCIFSPNVKNGTLDEKSFNIAKKDIQDKIDSEINNKRRYAIFQALKTAYKDEPAENTAYGTSETLQKVTAQSAYAGLQEIIKNSQIEISYVAAQKNDSVKKLVAETFSKAGNIGNTYSFIKFSPIKKQTAQVSETFDVNQSKMVLVFKSEKDDKYAMKMLSAIYGETPFSKLFANVREKMSLCYYCASSFSHMKNSIIVDCGVENKNIEIAKKEIVNQLDEITKGNFSDEDIEKVILLFENAFKGIGDTSGSYIEWYKSAVYEGEYLTPEQTLENYKNVTRERIIESAKSLVLDTVYVMKSGED